MRRIRGRIQRKIVILRDRRAELLKKIPGAAAVTGTVMELLVLPSTVTVTVAVPGSRFPRHLEIDLRRRRVQNRRSLSVHGDRSLREIRQQRQRAVSPRGRGRQVRLRQWSPAHRAKSAAGSWPR